MRQREVRVDALLALFAVHRIHLDGGLRYRHVEIVLLGTKRIPRPPTGRHEIVAVSDLLLLLVGQLRALHKARFRARLVAVLRTDDGGWINGNAGVDNTTSDWRAGRRHDGPPHRLVRRAVHCDRGVAEDVGHVGGTRGVLHKFTAPLPFDGMNGGNAEHVLTAALHAGCDGFV